jgi:hypothetical protein
VMGCESMSFKKLWMGQVQALKSWRLVYYRRR